MHMYCTTVPLLDTPATRNRDACRSARLTFWVLACRRPTAQVVDAIFDRWTADDELSVRLPRLMARGVEADEVSASLCFVHGLARLAGDQPLVISGKCMNTSSQGCACVELLRVMRV